MTGGWEPALAGLRALRERTLDVDLLMIVAALAAAAIGQVFDGALLIVIFATSGALEAVATAPYRRLGARRCWIWHPSGLRGCVPTDVEEMVDDRRARRR